MSERDPRIDPVVRRIPHEGPRVETGAVQFGDDWPGLFLRGDDAFYYAMALTTSLEHVPPGSQTAVVLRELRDWIDDHVVARVEP